MHRAITSLFLTLLISGCTTTKTIIDYKEVIKKPADILMTQCLFPFDERPKTYGEAVERDHVWHHSFSQCAKKIEGIRVFYQQESKQAP